MYAGHSTGIVTESRPAAEIVHELARAGVSRGIAHDDEAKRAVCEHWHGAVLDEPSLRRRARGACQGAARRQRTRRMTQIARA